MPSRFATLTLAASLLFTGTALAEPPVDICGGGCDVPLGTYSAALPEGEGPFPVLLYLHGAGGTGPGSLRGGPAAVAVKRGYAVIAPSGWQPVSRFPKNWGVADGRDYTRDDMAFLGEVMEDASTRFPIDTDRVLLGGFSRGGSMVWDIACQSPDFARAYAPVAGAFWDDLPDSCAGPVELFHTHGWQDRTVPLEGRVLGGGALTQGDVWASLFILRATNNCAKRQPETSSVEDGIWLRHWSDCEAGRIDLMLHPGGHSVPPGWATRALDWFEAALAEEVSQ